MSLLSIKAFDREHVCKVFPYTSQMLIKHYQFIMFLQPC